MKTLSPPLSTISASLSGDSTREHADLADAPETVELADVAPLDWQAIPVTEAVRSSIASHVAARDIPRNVAPQQGDIVLVSRIGDGGDKSSRDLGAVVGVLLNERVGADAWQGFIVAGEIEYVGEFDVLIEEGDEPVDPAACFIQTWNPVSVWPEARVRRLGRVSASRLMAVIEVSHESIHGKAQGALPMSLTRIGMRQLASGASVVAGTSVGGRADPRREYQSLYRALAIELTADTKRRLDAALQARPLKPTVPSNRLKWLWPTLTGVAFTIVIGQGLLLMNQTQPVWTESYRSITGPPKSTTNPTHAVRVAFKPGASYEAIAKALRDVGAQFISGPDDNGEVMLAVPAGRAREAATVLRLRDLVDSVEVIEPTSAK